MKKTFLQFLLYDALQMHYRQAERKKSGKSRLPHALIHREILERKLGKLFDKAYTALGELSCVAYVTKEPVIFSERESGRRIDLTLNGKWAEETFDCAWMHFIGAVPEIQGKELIVLLNTGGEGLVYDSEGIEKQGITCSASQYDYRLGMPLKRVVIAKELIKDGKLDFWVDAGANDLFGKFKNEARLGEMSIAVINAETRALAYDIEVLLSLYDYTGDKERNGKLYKDISECLKGIDTITEEAAVSFRVRLAPYFKEVNASGAFQYTAIGHSHLDLAWLWPLRESYRKGARTFTNQFLNLERYPSYIFGASQAQLYDWMKKLYPRVYGKVQQAVKDGRWELQGATWVEMDSNLIGGESLLRQFFYGKKFFKDEFDEDMEILWLPDSFGYSACIPGVMRLAGVKYFMTQKMSWNTVNKFPYHSFIWKGLDGSEALAHMLPENTYNSAINAHSTLFGERNYSERTMSSEALSLFGIGDGGGGPGFEHIERAVRMRDIKGLPRIKIGKSIDFFKNLEKGAAKYPVHTGELYLERHQGTATTQGMNKWYNRRMEFALRDYELLAVFAKSLGINIPINKKEIDEAWQEVLLYQFHDILPGSSINRVYTESRKRYAELYSRFSEAAIMLAKKLYGGSRAVNLNSFDAVKTLKTGGKWHRLAVPKLSSAVINSATEIKEFTSRVDENTIENDRIRIVFQQGLIVSLYDKAQKREFVPEGKAMNAFTRYTDLGDAWDIMPKNYMRSGKAAKCSCIKTGIDGASAFADISFIVKGAEIEERVTITDNSPLVELDIRILNSGKSSMLRIAFPAAVNTEECIYNIQFGHISRRTTENNSIEKAQFEVSGQKFVDMSEKDYGFSVINEGKYGYRCKHGVIDVDLLRNPARGPSTEVDYGENHIKLALLPHAGALGTETYREAYLFNAPLMITEGKASAHPLSAIEVSPDSVIIEGAKLSEDGSGAVLHIYNCLPESVAASIALPGYIPSEITDLMENKIAIFDGHIKLNGFEAACVKFTLKK